MDSIHFESSHGPEINGWDDVVITGYRMTFACGETIVLPFSLSKGVGRLDSTRCPGCGEPATVISTLFRKKTGMVHLPGEYESAVAD